VTLFRGMLWRENKFIIRVSEDLLEYDPTKGILPVHERVTFQRWSWSWIIVLEIAQMTIRPEFYINTVKTMIIN